MRRAGLGSLVVLAVAAAGCGGTKSVTVTATVSKPAITVTVTTAPAAGSTAACLASALTGNFALVPGSGAAGQIGYRLRLTNQSDAACFVSGLPEVQLLDQQGGKLPTNVSPVHPGTATAVRVDLAPGDAATADAHFSPDIPADSEPTDGPCESQAHTLRVTVGDGTVDAPVVPPTPVCERGTLNFSNFTASQ